MRNYSRFLTACSLVAAFAVPLVALGDSAPKVPKNPATLEFSVSPDPVAPGGEVRVAMQLSPKPGIKINRYPKIKLTVPGQEGLVTEAEAAIGNESPPPPDRMETNYYKEVEPLELVLRLDEDAKPGRHELPAKVRYFFCVAESGFCAPKHVGVTIPVSIESR